MKTAAWVAAAMLAAAARAEVVETAVGPVACWSARATPAGLSVVCSNGVRTLDWALVTDKRFPAPAGATVGDGWYARFGERYAEIGGHLVRRP